MVLVGVTLANGRVRTVYMIPAFSSSSISPSLLSPHPFFVPFFPLLCPCSGASPFLILKWGILGLVSVGALLYLLNAIRAMWRRRRRRERDSSVAVDVTGDVVSVCAYARVCVCVCVHACMRACL